MVLSWNLSLMLAAGFMWSSAAAVAQAENNRFESTLGAVNYYFYCSGKSVGNYEDPNSPCSNRFFSCVADGHPARGIQRFCPKGLYFTEEHNTCYERQYVTSCNPVIPKPIVKKTDFEHFMLLHNQFVGICKDGHYFQHPDEYCSHRYIVCEEGHLVVRSCPFSEHLRFDPVTERCLQPQFVKACNPDLQLSPHHTDQRDQRSEVLCPSYGTVFLPHPRQTCSSDYYACVSGESFSVHCPRNLLFDRLSQQCQSPQYMPSCHNYVRLPSTTNTLRKVVPVTVRRVDPYPVPHTAVNLLQELVAYPDISNQQAGTHLPALERIQALINAQTNTQQESRQLVELPFANLQLEEMDKTGIHTANSLDGFHHGHPKNIMCWSRDNGMYEVAKCLSTYYTCDTGKMYEQHCPDNHVFAGVYQGCVAPDSFGCDGPR